MSLIMELITPKLSELSALELEKIATFDFVYSLASANIDQSAPNLATVYTPIRSWMNLIMGKIEQEHAELFALEFEKVAEYDRSQSVMYKYTPISTKLCQSVYDYKISDEFDYGSNRTRTVPSYLPLN